MKGLHPTDLFFKLGGSGNLTMVSWVVRLMIWGGGVGGGVATWWGGVTPNWVAGMGWLGRRSGLAGGSPAPANEDTDWITGMDVSAAIEVELDDVGRLLCDGDDLTGVVVWDEPFDTTIGVFWVPLL